MKSKPKSPKASRNEAQRFLWHLAPPWRNRFSHDHWWPKQPEGIEGLRIGALWEVLRRHPKVETFLDWPELPGMPLRINSRPVPLGSVLKAAARYAVTAELHKARRAEPVNDLQLFVADHCFESWRKLTDAEQAEWRKALEHLPPQRGLDPRPVVSLTAASVHSDYYDERNFDSAEQARKANVERLAGELHEAGWVLMAFPPGVQNLDKVGETAKACYAQHRTKPDRGLWRVDKCLNAIKAFETDELSRSPKQSKRDKDLFTGYYRSLRSFVW